MRTVKADDAVIWDIETRPATMEQVEAISPFDGEGWIAAQEAKIKKHGSYKAETKEKKIAELPDLVEGARKDHYQKAIADSALNPLLCQVLCITISHEIGKMLVLDGDEHDILTEFWRDVVGGAYSIVLEHDQERVKRTITYVGWNTHQFDLPLLWKRTMLLDLSHEVLAGEHTKMEDIRDWRGYWGEMFIDLREQWGRDRFEPGTLDQVAKAMGHGGKSEPSGAKFWHHWQHDRERANEYLRTEMQTIWEVGIQMGVIL